MYLYRYTILHSNLSLRLFMSVILLAGLNSLSFCQSTPTPSPTATETPTPAPTIPIEQLNNHDGGTASFFDGPCTNHNSVTGCPCGLGSMCQQTIYSGMSPSVSVGGISYNPLLQSIVFPAGGMPVSGIGDVYTVPAPVYRSYSTFAQPDEEGQNFHASFDPRIQRVDIGSGTESYYAALPG